MSRDQYYSIPHEGRVSKKPEIKDCRCGIPTRGRCPNPKRSDECQGITCALCSLRSPQQHLCPSCQEKD